MRERRNKYNKVAILIVILIDFFFYKYKCLVFFLF